MGLLDKLTQKRHEQVIDKKIKQAKGWMAAGKYQEAHTLLKEMALEMDEDEERYDVVIGLQVECEQAIDRAGAEKRAKSAPKAAPPAPAPKPEVKLESKSEPMAEMSSNPESLFKEAMNIHRTDKVKYHRLIERAAELGHVWSQRLNGSCYYLGEGCEKDREKALFWYLKAAQNGDAEAQWQCGDMYEHGQGCEKDPATALQWYIKAAEQGKYLAQSACARCYQYGIGCTKDLEKALYWYQKVADGGDSFAAGQVKKLSAVVAPEPEPEEAPRRSGLKRYSRQEHAAAEAQYRQGMEHYGREEYPDAMERFYTAVEATSHTEAQYQLGVMYDKGEGVLRDQAEAEKWYRGAAERGHEEAKSRLDALRGAGEARQERAAEVDRTADAVPEGTPKRMTAFEAARRGQESLNRKAEAEKQPAPAAKPEPKPAVKTPAANEKPIAEIRNGEAFLWGERPVIMMDNGGKVNNGRLYCIIADFRNGPAKLVYFPARLRFPMLNIPVTSVKKGSVYAGSGEREFTDAQGNTVTFRPYRWAEVALARGEGEPEVQIAKYEGKYYVVSVRWEGDGITPKSMGPKPDRYIEEGFKEYLFLLDNEMYYYESDGYASEQERMLGELEAMTKTNGFHQHTVRRWRDGKRCSVSLHFDDQLPISRPEEVTLEYQYEDEGLHYFMDPEDYETTLLAEYMLPAVPDEEDAGESYRLTFAFGEVIRMEAVSGDAQQSECKPEQEIDAERAFEAGVAAYDRGDHASAAKYFREVAELGVAEAQFNLGLMYSHGEGVAQNKAEAAKWYRKAAEQGHTSAQYNLGLMYNNGTGVAQDKAEAVKWYRKAAEAGHASAQFNLGLMYSHGEGVTQSKAEAAKWYRKAAEQGNAKAQNNLAGMYCFGEGVPRDLAEAEKWAKRATDSGDENAAKLLELIRNDR